jgi:peptidoglycan hydrolase-like protein with peptidoglycan-binding domain
MGKRLMIAVSAAALLAALPAISSIAMAQSGLPSTYSIRNLQLGLQQLGYLSGSVDGRAGPQTREAIRKYQGDYGLELTGNPSPAFYQQLRAGTATASAAATASATDYPVTGRRAERRTLREIQGALAARGYDPGETDGVMHPRTRSAIRAFQTDARLDVTGEPSPLLLNQLHTGASAAGGAALRIADSFTDGDYTQNPAWTVRSGQWQVTGGIMRSHVAVAAAPAQSGDIGQAMLREFLARALGAAAPGASFSPTAMVSTAGPVDNAFHVQMRLSARGDSHAMFGPYQSSITDGYRIAYAGNVNGRPGLQILAIAGDQVRVVATAGNVPRLDDGNAHVIDWRRQRSGQMAVAVDGRTVLSVRDNGLPGMFSGFTITNAGGDLGVHDVLVQSASAQISQR